MKALDNAVKANDCIINYHQKATMHETIIHDGVKKIRNEPDSINNKKSVVGISAALWRRVPL